MRFVVVTGPSGAGKTLALHSLEDAGYYAVDNLPPRLLPELVVYCQQERIERACAVVDARCGKPFAELPAVLRELSKTTASVETLFLDASDDALVSRYKETRRPHALLRSPASDFAESGILEAIEAERDLLNAARACADRILDTSLLTGHQLRDLLHVTYAPELRPGLLVTVISFGFKHGLPIDADLVFDVRFLANPHYVSALRARDGRDKQVRDFVHADPLTAPFADRMNNLVEFALPQYQREGKAYCNIAIGCTGGKHRSVVLAEDLAARLRAEGFQVALRHRDVGQVSPVAELPALTDADFQFSQGGHGSHLSLASAAGKTTEVGNGSHTNTELANEIEAHEDFAKRPRNPDDETEVSEQAGCNE